MDYSLRSLTVDDKDIIYTWRNSEEIRRNMYNDQPIPYEHHDRWFNDILINQICNYQLFMYQNKRLGLVSFKVLPSQHKTSVWGFYIGEKNAPIGSGTIMGILGLDYAFHCLNMRKVIGEVLSFNHKSERFHLKLGFQREGAYKNKINQNNKRIDILHFELCKDEWEVHKKKLKLNYSIEV